MKRHRWGRLAIAVSVVALLATACGGGKNDSSSSSSGSNTLRVGSDIAYPPVEFYKEGTKDVQGIDYDLCQAVAKEMGKSGCTFQNVTFDGLIPALKTKRFDAIFSAMSDTAKRQEEITFVDYFTVGTSIIVKKGNPEGIKGLDDLCGRTIGVQRGTTQETVSNAQKVKCQAAGKDLTVLTFDTDVDAQQALRAGRSVADMNDFPVAAYVAQQAGDFEVVGEQIEAGPYGVGIRKDDTALRDQIQTALKAVIASGEYDRILAKWNVSQGALKTAAVNGGS
ncbi:MAG TPA: ABC transporter substrate-binding protein [Acidimicrobiales bacterium]|nr:ABC transporter substrate-binding protein [Acidimicrobiales bacterium]